MKGDNSGCFLLYLILLTFSRIFFRKSFVFPLHIFIQNGKVVNGIDMITSWQEKALDFLKKNKCWVNAPDIRKSKTKTTHVLYMSHKKPRSSVNKYFFSGKLATTPAISILYEFDVLCITWKKNGLCIINTQVVREKNIFLTLVTTLSSLVLPTPKIIFMRAYLH